MASDNFVIGAETKISLTIMPSESLLQETLSAPGDVAITLTAAVTAADETLTVTAVTGPVPIGTPILLTEGSDTLLVYTSGHVATGATSIPIEAADSAIGTGATGTYTAMLVLEGGTTSDESINNSDTESITYGKNAGWSTGKVTSAGWEASYSFNVLPDDLGYRRLLYAAQNAVKGVRVWVRKEDPAPEGKTSGDYIEGLADVLDFTKSNPADNIITGSCTFKGRGAPVTGRAA